MGGGRLGRIRNADWLAPRRSAVLCLLLACFALSASAQFRKANEPFRPGAAKRDEVPTFRSDVRLVPLLVTVKDARGELILFAADPKEFRLIDRRKVSEQETWGHLAVADNDLFVRELRAIAAYRWK